MAVEEPIAMPIMIGVLRGDDNCVEDWVKVAPGFKMSIMFVSPGFAGWST